MTLLVLAAAAILGLSLVVIIPPWQSPDEPTHFEYAYVLSRGGAPWSPRPDPALQEQVIVSLDRNDYWRYVGVERPSPLPRTFRETPFLSAAPTQIGKNPPLYYVLASLVLRIAPARTLEAELYRLRLLSLLFTILTVVLVAGIAARVFGRESPLVPASAAAVAFLPQFLVIGTSVSSDPCFNFCSAAVIFLMIRCQKSRFTIFRTIIILLCIGLGILVNYKGLILLAAFPGVVIIHCLFRHGRFPSLGRVAGRAGLILLLLLAGYSALVWHFPELARIFVVRINILCSTVCSFFRGRTRFPPGFWPWFNSELIKSFWLKYGWLKFEIPLIVYSALTAAAAAAMPGIGWFLVKRLRSRPSARSVAAEPVITLLFLSGTTLAVVYLFWGLKASSAITQGRHLFMMMAAWGVLFTLGWSSFFPARWARRTGYCLTGAFFLLAAVSILFFIRPAFS